MKTVQIQYDAGKLDALRRYGKDEARLQTELAALLQTLYETYVPTEERRRRKGRKIGV